MEVKPSGFTIAEYCEQMDAGTIIVNPEYQRTPRVWPAPARSFLIDTILLGYPIPKISLFQKTDLISRKTTKEIVDGQQRSMAIQAFYKDTLRITGHSTFANLRYSDLEDEYRARFLGYQLTVDLFVSATDNEIRQVFRRINSYTVPLNPEELRHAKYQGEFKFFVIKMTELFAPLLKEIGTFSERQLNRMQDAKLVTELSMGIVDGVATYSKRKLDQFYESRDERFPEEKDLTERLERGFGVVSELSELHGGPLVKPAVLYTLLLAITHFQKPISALNSLHARRRPRKLDLDNARENLTVLASVLEEPERATRKYKSFIDACSQGTNTEKNRRTRFCWLSEALDLN